MTLHLIVNLHDIQQMSFDTFMTIITTGGVTHLQLREKNASLREILAVGKQLKSHLASCAIPLLINDRIDIALALEADGVHLGQTDMPYAIARSILGSKKIIGLSVTSLAQLKTANEYDAQYIGIGPIFETRTKLDALTPLGLEAFHQLTQATQHPVVAIGGIKHDNAAAILSHGAAGLAISAAICHASDPLNACQVFKKIISTHS